ncbi:MAG: 50S ribosomal protein L37ae [Thermoprotei archaeon]|nr:MAG: 50S ribosomal protein L37ae [Thermoprotei archaeon]
MGRTKIVGPAGRYGARYGSTLRKRVKLIEEKRLAHHRCPKCNTAGKLTRISIGIWTCRKCGYTFAGGAWIPRTILGKSFAPEEIKELKKAYKGEGKVIHA